MWKHEKNTEKLCLRTERCVRVWNHVITFPSPRSTIVPSYSGLRQKMSVLPSIIQHDFCYTLCKWGDNAALVILFSIFVHQHVWEWAGVSGSAREWAHIYGEGVCSDVRGSVCTCAGVCTEIYMIMTKCFWWPMELQCWTHKFLIVRQTFKETNF